MGGGRLIGHHTARHRSRPGDTPGIESVPDRETPPDPAEVTIQCTDYSPDDIQSWDVPFESLDELLQQSPPDGSAVRWINVNSVHPYLVDQFRQALGFHTLAAEDVLHVPQRPKVEAYEDHLFVVARMLTRDANGCLASEQVSMFLYPHLLVTFQEHNGDVWDPIRRRLSNRRSKLRRGTAAYLLYSLLDSLVDHCFPLVEQIASEFEELEAAVLERPDRNVIRRIHALRAELSIFRNVLWPTRELVARLCRDEDDMIDEQTQLYLRDVSDHTVQLIDVVESLREVSTGLSDLYLSSLSHRMNEIMKVLTIVASIFIPLTFVAGVYGMNFEHMPELGWQWAYPAVWAVFVIVVLSMIVLFYRKGWFSR